MTASSIPSWHFAPTGGGAEHGNSAGQHYFVNDAVTKTVREVLQNSVDHPAPGIDAVELTCRLMQVSPDDIGAAQLKRHIESSLCEVTADNDRDAIKRYEQMLETVAKPTIPCLAMIDSGTTGLQGNNWRNLIFREGTPTNVEGQTKGGSYGFGKNAPFNLSACNTVLYSTRYLSVAKKGRVEHLAGRSQLVSHDHPEHLGQPGMRLQQTGFWAVHSDKPNQPVEGPDIPQPLRLSQPGTGVFIIGFDTGAYPNWAEETALATVTQFFYAIHTRNLVVMIDEGHGNGPRVIDHDTLPIELDNCPSDDPTRHYWQAVADNEPIRTQPSGRLDQMGQMELWVSTNKGAPRKTAHINRRGMLITDARLFGTNPFYPSGGAGWPDWCAVTMAHDESAEAFIRRMEPPAHDAIHFRQIRERDQQKIAEFEVRHQRDQITQIVKARIDDALLEASNNVDELARLFPDVPDLRQGVHALKWRDRQHTERSNDVVDLVDASDENEAVEDPEGELEIEIPNGRDHERKGSGGGNGGGENNFDEPETRRVNPKPSEHAIRHARIMRVAPSELVMTFTTPSQPAGSIRFGIKAAGEQYQKHEESIRIDKIKQTGSLLAKATLDGDTVEVTAPPDTPVTLRLALDTEGAPYLSYSIAQIQQQAVQT
jgi:hypothetical protein